MHENGHIFCHTFADKSHLWPDRTLGPGFSQSNSRNSSLSFTVRPVCPEYNNWHMLHSRECFATANVCQKVVKENKNVSGSVTVTVYFFKFIIQGLARTQTPTLINCVPELPTFGVIAGVSPVEVQWKGLLLGEPPFLFFINLFNLPIYNKNRWGVNSPTRPTPLWIQYCSLKKTYENLYISR